jgi:hypothetical protein
MTWWWWDDNNGGVRGSHGYGSGNKKKTKTIENYIDEIDFNDWNS